MDYLAYLFLSHLPHIEEEVRYIDGKEQVCLIIPTETNQIKRGKQGNWLMIMFLTARDANAKMITHDLRLMYLTEEACIRSRKLGYHNRTSHLGRVYVHDRTPSKKIDRTNNFTDIKCDGAIILSDIPKELIFHNAENNKRLVQGVTFKKIDSDDTIYTGSLCIDDIPPADIKTDRDTGKKYVLARFIKLPSLDVYMNTHTLIVAKDDNSMIEIGRFKEWTKVGNKEIAPKVTPSERDEEHQTTINQRPPIDSIDGIKF